MDQATDVPVTDPTRDANDGDKAPGAKPNAQEPDGSKSRTVEGDVDSLPDWAQKEIKRLNYEAMERRKTAREQENAAKAQREQSLAEQEQWKTLAEERLQEIGKLKVRAEQFDELSVLFDKQYTDEVKEWPTDLMEMAPPPEAALTQRLAWLEKARPMAKKLMQSAPSDTSAPRQPVGGNRRGPDPATQSLRNQPASGMDSGPLVDARKKF